MTIRLALFMVLVGSSSALAEPGSFETPDTKNQFIGLGWTTSDGGPNAHSGVAIEGAHRLADTPGFLHAAIAVGRSDDDNGPHASVKGAFEEARVGIEVHGSGHLIRLFGGIDLGLQLDHRERRMDDGASMFEAKSHFLMMPRIGVEVGTRVRMRAALGFAIHEQIAGPSDYEDPADDWGGTTDAAFELGLGYGF